MNEPKKIGWDEQARKMFDQMIARVPWAMRKLAREAVIKKAHSLVKEDKRTMVNEKDLVDAFFDTTPFGFQGPMMSDMEELGIDYKKYGHPVEPEGWGRPKYD